jgi:hypothetical protein
VTPSVVVPQTGPSFVCTSVPAVHAGCAAACDEAAEAAAVNATAASATTAAATAPIDTTVRNDRFLLHGAPRLVPVM